MISTGRVPSLLFYDYISGYAIAKQCHRPLILAVDPLVQVAGCSIAGVVLLTDSLGSLEQSSCYHLSTH